MFALMILQTSARRRVRVLSFQTEKAHGAARGRRAAAVAAALHDGARDGRISTPRRRRAGLCRAPSAACRSMISKGSRAGATLTWEER